MNFPRKTPLGKFGAIAPQGFASTFQNKNLCNSKGVYPMKQIICPIDGKPCEKNCPDRYTDWREGGCVLTTAQELGATIINLGGGNFASLFQPSRRKDGEK